MSLLLVKLLMTSSLIAFATMVARRYGPRAGGLLIGLPLTSGPVSVLLASQRGADFSAHAALTAIGGTIGVGWFCGAYAACARYTSWPLALAAGLTTFAISIAAFRCLPIGFAAAVGLGLAILYGLWRWLTRVACTLQRAVAPTAATPLPTWEIPARILMSAALIGAVTTFAPRLGPNLCGVLSVVPVLTAVMAAFTHHRSGSSAATSLLIGTIGGEISSIVFFALVGALLSRWTMLSTYSSASVSAIVVNGAWARFSHRMHGTPKTDHRAYESSTQTNARR
jgi:hypothetical protein